MQSEGEHRGGRRRYFLCGVFLLILALGTVEGPRGDAARRLAITRQLLVNHRLHITQEPIPAGLIETQKGWTSYFSIGQTLLFIPFEVADKAISLLPPIKDFRGIVTRSLYPVIVGVAYVLALAWLLEAFDLSVRTGAIVSLLFTFCSLSAYYVAQSFQDEAAAGVFVCLALRATLLWKQRRDKRYAFQTGLFIATAMLFRPNAVFALLPLAVVFLQGLHGTGVEFRGIRQAVGAAALGAAGPGAIYAIFAYLRFGSLFSTGYDQLGMAGLDYTDSSKWAIFLIREAGALLFGLGKGLFIYSPLLVIALWGMWIDRRKFPLYSIACLLALVGGVIFGISAFPTSSDGCWSWGTRFQVHLLPFFAYPAWTGMRDLRQRRLGAAVVAAAGLGLFFQICGLVGSDRVEYRQIVNPDPDEVCRQVRDHQFEMRLGNISRMIRLAAQGQPETDILLRGEFGTLWVLRHGRDYAGWAKIGVVFAWFGILTCAVACLYHALRRAKD